MGFYYLITKPPAPPPPLDSIDNISEIDKKEINHGI